MAANETLVMVCVGGVEVTKILRDVRKDRWVAAALRGTAPSFQEPSV
jgi:hypothetical protein